MENEHGSASIVKIRKNHILFLLFAVFLSLPPKDNTGTQRPALSIQHVDKLHGNITDEKRQRLRRQFSVGPGFAVVNKIARHGRRKDVVERDDE